MRPRLPAMAETDATQRRKAELADAFAENAQDIQSWRGAFPSVRLTQALGKQRELLGEFRALVADSERLAQRRRAF